MFNKRCLYLVLGVFVGCSQTVMALERLKRDSLPVFVVRDKESHKIVPVTEMSLRDFTPLYACGFSPVFYVTNKDTFIGGERVPEDTLVGLSNQGFNVRFMNRLFFDSSYKVYEFNSESKKICTREPVRALELRHTHVLPNGLIKKDNDEDTVYVLQQHYEPAWRAFLPGKVFPFESETHTIGVLMPKSGDLRLAMEHFSALSDARSRRWSELRAVFVGAVVRAGQKRLVVMAGQKRSKESV